MTFKYNPISNQFDMVGGTSNRIPETGTTYVIADATTKKVQIYVDGTMVAEWG
jgi:hypothetical protein